LEATPQVTRLEYPRLLEADMGLPLQVATEVVMEQAMEERAMEERAMEHPEFSFIDRFILSNDSDYIINFTLNVCTQGRFCLCAGVPAFLCVPK
jgi:hypothetical protein